jgi:hypothetical protein
MKKTQCHFLLEKEKENLVEGSFFPYKVNYRTLTGKKLFLFFLVGEKHINRCVMKEEIIKKSC